MNARFHVIFYIFCFAVSHSVLSLSYAFWQLWRVFIMKSVLFTVDENRKQNRRIGHKKKNRGQTKQLHICIILLHSFLLLHFLPFNILSTDKKKQTFQNFIIRNLFASDLCWNSVDRYFLLLWSLQKVNTTQWIRTVDCCWWQLVRDLQTPTCHS